MSRDPDGYLAVAETQGRWYPGQEGSSLLAPIPQEEEWPYVLKLATMALSYTLILPGH
jgi:hypothetical protein